jgi:hypothetical protein
LDKFARLEIRTSQLKRSATDREGGSCCYSGNVLVQQLQKKTHQTRSCYSAKHANNNFQREEENQYSPETEITCFFKTVPCLNLISLDYVSYFSEYSVLFQKTVISDELMSVFDIFVFWKHIF